MEYGIIVALTGLVVWLLNSWAQLQDKMKCLKEAHGQDLAALKAAWADNEELEARIHLLSLEMGTLQRNYLAIAEQAPRAAARVEQRPIDNNEIVLPSGQSVFWEKADGSDTRFLKVWNDKVGLPKYTPEGKCNPPAVIAYSPDGSIARLRWSGKFVRHENARLDAATGIIAEFVMMMHPKADVMNIEAVAERYAAEASQLLDAKPDNLAKASERLKTAEERAAEAQRLRQAREEGRVV